MICNESWAEQVRVAREEPPLLAPQGAPDAGAELRRAMPARRVRVHIRGRAGSPQAGAAEGSLSARIAAANRAAADRRRARPARSRSTSLATWDCEIASATPVRVAAGSRAATCTASRKAPPTIAADSCAMSRARRGVNASNSHTAIARPHCGADQRQSNQRRISQQPAGPVEHGAHVGDGQHQDRDRAERACRDRQRAGGEHAPAPAAARPASGRGCRARGRCARRRSVPARSSTRSVQTNGIGQPLAAGGPALLHDAARPT